MIFKKLRLEKRKEELSGFAVVAAIAGAAIVIAVVAANIVAVAPAAAGVAGVAGVALIALHPVAAEYTLKSFLKLLAATLPFILLIFCNNLGIINLGWYWILIILSLVELFYWLDKSRLSEDYGKFLGIPVITFAKKFEAFIESLLALSGLNAVITIIRVISDNWDLTLDILGWTGIILLIAGGVWIYFYINGLKYNKE